MTLVAEAGDERNLGNGQVAAREQVPRVLQAAVVQVPHGTLTETSLELPGEVEATEPGYIGEITKRYALAKILQDVLMYQLKCPTTQSMGKVFWLSQADTRLTRIVPRHNCTECLMPWRS